MSTIFEDFGFSEPDWNKIKPPKGKNYILNPFTNRWIKLYGPTYKKLYKNYIPIYKPDDTDQEYKITIFGWKYQSKEK